MVNNLTPFDVEKLEKACVKNKLNTLSRVILATDFDPIALKKYIQSVKKAKPQSIFILKYSDILVQNIVIPTETCILFHKALYKRLYMKPLPKDFNTMVKDIIDNPPKDLI
jgi:hypothetical protein